MGYSRSVSSWGCQPTEGQMVAGFSENHRCLLMTSLRICAAVCGHAVSRMTCSVHRGPFASIFSKVRSRWPIVVRDSISRPIPSTFDRFAERGASVITLAGCDCADSTADDCWGVHGNVHDSAVILESPDLTSGAGKTSSQDFSRHNGSANKPVFEW